MTREKHELRRPGHLPFRVHARRAGRGMNAAFKVRLGLPGGLVVLAALVALAAGCGTERRAEQGASSGSAAAQLYHCPMHPTFITDNAKAECPICGMSLVAVTGAAGADAADAGAGPGGVPGMAPIAMTPEGMRLAGVQTARVERESVAPYVRTVGLVVPDESRVRHVHVKVSGWVEKLHVNTTGQSVRAGSPVLAIYSPELLAGQEEYVRARAAAASLPATAAPETRRRFADLVQAARSRLLLLDVPASLLERLDGGGVAERTVTLVAPISGTVTAKDVVEGHRVEPGGELFTVTDLARIWVEADLYEYDAAWVRVGQGATVTLPYDPSVSLEGEVSFIYPLLDPRTRTTKVRFEFLNQELALKPGMFTNVEFYAEATDGLFVPDEAVMDTGVRQIVFVNVGEGEFAPRAVRLGLRSGGRAQILAGLEEGDRVAVRANFLLDSESKIRSSIAGMTAAAQTGGSGGAGAGHGAHAPDHGAGR